MWQFTSAGFYITSIFCLLFFSSFSQKEEAIYNHTTTNDTALLDHYGQLERDFTETYRDSSIYYGYKALAIAKKLNQKYYQGFILCDLAYDYLNNGDYSNSLKCLIEATKLSEDNDIGLNILKTSYIELNLQKDAESNRKELQAWIKNSLGILYGLTGSSDKKLHELLEAKQLVENVTTDMFLLSGITSNIVEVYISRSKFDSALYYQRLTMEYESKSDVDVYKGVSLATMGEIFRLQGKPDSAKKNLFAGIKIMDAQGENIVGPAQAYISMANIYYDSNQPDSGIYYARKALINFSVASTSDPQILDAYTSLALNYYKNNRYDSAYKYMAIAKTMRDSLSDIRIANLSKFQSIGFEEKLKLKDLENETIVNKSRNKVILLLVVIIVFLVIGFILHRNNKLKQKTNKLLEATLNNLKSTQSQLIQSEKMASLGELTAGIAHEIQNPLNFVNNFSEVNKEMIAEMKEEIDKGNYDGAKLIANDISDNEEKINHHGKRADAIVKGMLQHSRASTGQKEPTDINALADEYLRLAYHGLRAKDNSFNATMKTEFDSNIGSINIIPQDIGRVLLNLYGNAFYACAERSRSVTNVKRKEQSLNYEPTVSVSTMKISGKVEVKIEDNGNGIPQKILDKIFQPFFTTKPTGEGTGLGLSLSYDIIKAHGGEIKVETKEGKGTTFIIRLPVV